MAVLAAQKIAKSFAQRELFSNVSFQLNARERVGLVGVNGSGKTTLFRILCGMMPPDEGAVYLPKDVRLAYLEQMPQVEPGLTVYEAALRVFDDLMRLEAELESITERISAKDGELERLVRRQVEIREYLENNGGLTYRSRVRSMLLGLGFPKEQQEQRFDSLSGGQASKVMLAKLLLSEADVLLLDEPTNHLDIESVEWLEQFLKEYRGALIVISHDRYFLDKVTTRTMEIRNGVLLQTAGNYTTHVEQQSTAQEIELRHYRNTQREIKRLYGIVEQQRRWNRERNIRTAESKLKQIARLEKTLVVPKNDPKSLRFSFSVPEMAGNDVLIVSGMEKAFSQKALFRNLELHIKKGEKVFLLGPNGCGKTTLLKILMGRESADKGNCVLGANVERGYYEQNMSGLSGTHTVMEEMTNAFPRRTQTEIRNALATFLFREDDVLRQLDKLSGGERARVQLLKLMLSPVNFLLLDEPTNHLDIASREALENALDEYEGTILVVTHDRYLVNRLADRIVYMTQDGLTEFIGGYDEYLQARAQEAEEKEPEKIEKTNDYKLQREWNGKMNRAKGALKRAEEQVAAQEEQVAAMEAELAAPEVARDYRKAAELSAAIDIEKEKLDALYEAWEEAETALRLLQEEQTEQMGETL